MRPLCGKEFVSNFQCVDKVTYHYLVIRLRVFYWIFTNRVCGWSIRKSLLQDHQDGNGSPEVELQVTTYGHSVPSRASVKDRTTELSDLSRSYLSVSIIFKVFFWLLIFVKMNEYRYLFLHTHTTAPHIHIC